MVETKHTPGPWFLINDHCVGGPETTNGAGHGIAMCGMRARSEEEAKANALLIASAPELLKELQRLVAEVYWLDGVHKSRAVIAKATGKSAA